MFGVGFIKGTLIGMGFGVVTGLALKELCKKIKINNSKSETVQDNDAS